MTNASPIPSSIVSQQQIPTSGRTYLASLYEQPVPRKMNVSAHSSLCACASCFPDPIA